MSEMEADGLTLHLTNDPVRCLAAVGQVSAELAKQQAVELYAAHLAAGRAAQRRMQALLALQEHEQGVALVQPGVDPEAIRAELMAQAEQAAGDITEAMNAAANTASLLQLVTTSAHAAYAAIKFAREIGPEVTGNPDPDVPLGPRAV